MKKLLMAAAAASALFATPALADGDNTSTDIESFTINANNPAKCNLEATTYTLTLPNNSLTDNDGFALPNVSAAVATAMNQAGVTAWCTGNQNKLQMYRTAFTTGTGVQTTDGFNQAVVYDVLIDINNAVRSDGADPQEGTSDGQGNGPGLGVGGGLFISRFGPTGTGSTVQFSSEQPSFAASNNNNTGARTGFTNAQSNRLVAGPYTSTLTIELTPVV